MNAGQASSKTIGQKAWIAIRFVVFGIVGFWVMLGFTGAFASRVFGHDQDFVSPFLSLPLVFVGAAMTLYGAGVWGRWAYLWVFLSIPISVCCACLVPSTENSKEFPVIFAGMAAFFTYAGVKVYYHACDYYSRGISAEPTQDGNDS